MVYYFIRRHNNMPGNCNDNHVVQFSYHLFPTIYLLSPATDFE